MLYRSPQSSLLKGPVNMFVTRIVASAALAAFIAVPAIAQNQAPAGDGPPVLANKLAPARGGSLRMLLGTSAWHAGQDLPEKYTQNGDNVSPPLEWSRGPAGTQSYAILAEDAGVNRHDPIVHWVIYNIPSTTTSLPASVPTDATLEDGAMQGKNVRGAAGYIGPKPPAGQIHGYHFEIFALNTNLKVDPANADRNTIVNAMKNHVLAQGELVANYAGK